MTRAAIKSQFSRLKIKELFFIVYISFYLLTRFALQVLAASPPGVTRSLGKGEREEERRREKKRRGKLKLLDSSGSGFNKIKERKIKVTRVSKYAEWILQEKKEEN